MDPLVENEEMEANELLDETQRLRHKRDLLTKENEQLKSYLRLRQMESTATCEQLKSEIEQQIEQFEALGDTETNHLETLKSFRSEIEAIQCWNAKIRNKYFSRNSNINLSINQNNICLNNEEVSRNRTDDQLIVSSGSGAESISAQHFIQNNDNKSLDKGLDNNNSNDNDMKQMDSINPQISCKSKPKRLTKRVNSGLNAKKDNSYNIITRSKQKSIAISNKRKNPISLKDKNEIQNKRKPK